MPATLEQTPRAAATENLDKDGRIQGDVGGIWWRMAAWGHIMVPGTPMCELFARVALELAGHACRACCCAKLEIGEASETPPTLPNAALF